MKTKSILFISLIFLLHITLLFASTHTKHFEKTINFQSNGNIFVSNVNGKIEVTSWDKETIRIEAEIKVNTHNRREAEEILERVKILIDRQGEKITIKPDYPHKERESGFWDWLLGSYKTTPIVDFTIKVPQKSNLDLKSTNGNVFAAEIKGAVTLATVNGGIEAETINGSANANTTNGGIKINDLNGSLNTHTTNGSITAIFSGFDTNNNIDMSTTNGSIKLTLPSNIKADVTASTVNGSIHTDFALTVKGKIMKKRINGEINGGGGLIDLSTVNGSIKIYEH